MAEQRKVEKHFLPNEYDGRCTGDQDYISQWLSYGGDLPEGETLHKFEMRLPIPKTDDEAQKMYNKSLDDLVRDGVAKLGTIIDDSFKPVLFKGIDAPEFAENANEKAHLKAQEKADGWRYTPRTGSGKTTAVSNVVASLVAAGVLTEEQAESIETNDDLQRTIASLNK